MNVYHSMSSSNFSLRGAARIRELFADSEKNSPSILFSDELDAVGDRWVRKSNDERGRTLNQVAQLFRSMASKRQSMCQAWG